MVGGDLSLDFLLELFVNDVETKSISSPLHLCDQVANLLLSLHLLLQVLALDEVSQLGVSVGVSYFVHLKQRLMNLLFQLKRGFDSTQCGDPVIGLSLGNILEDYASTSHVLVLDELHGMIAPLRSWLGTS